MIAWYRPIRLSMWGIWSLIALWAGVQWRAPNVPVRVPAAASVQARQHAQGDSAQTLLAEVSARMPFDNADAMTQQSESATASADTFASQPPAVQLTLSGVVDGRVQQAIIVGLPGTDGSRAMRIGERVGTARLLEVTARRAVVDVNGARVELPLGKPTLLSH